MKTAATTTAQVAKYLEREDVRPFTLTLAGMVLSTHMDASVLAYHLHALMEDVNEENGDKLNLSKVDWETLAERYLEMAEAA